MFDLLGKLETDMTAALGYAIARSGGIAESVLRLATDNAVIPTPTTSVTLEHSRCGEGRTDIEIAVPGRALIVIEAKRGARLPTRAQLALYAPRLQRAERDGLTPVLMLVTDASSGFACVQMQGLAWPGIALVHASWSQLARFARNAARTTRGRQQTIAKEYLEYLSRDDDMDQRRSNMAYVVALGTGSPAGWGLSWQDVVRERSRYFYPVGHRWPETPPTYIAFRYGGQLQSIHYVESYSQFTRPRDVFPEAADEQWEPTTV
ncbi:MAG: hypothetical protein ACR2M1_12465 [Gemmatimonadaceae bacterium]